MKLIVLVCLILLHLAALAEQTADYELNRGYFTFGSLTQFPGEYQIDTAGTKSSSFDFHPYFAGGLEYTLPEDWFITVEGGLTVPETTADEALTLYTLFLRSDFAYRVLGGRLKLLIGSSIMMMIMKGNGGTTTLGNAGSSTTFYRPELTQTTYNNTFDLGAEYRFNQEWGARAQLIAYSIFDSEKTQYSYTLSINYSWDLSQ